MQILSAGEAERDSPSVFRTTTKCSTVVRAQLRQASFHRSDLFKHAITEEQEATTDRQKTVSADDKSYSGTKSSSATQGEMYRGSESPPPSRGDHQSSESVYHTPMKKLPAKFSFDKIFQWEKDEEKKPKSELTTLFLILKFNFR